MKKSDICTFISNNMQMTIEENQQQIIDEFSVFDDWMDKYGYLIEMGNELPPLAPSEKTDEYLIKGCQSRVWLVPEYKDGKIFFQGESDAVIVKGLVALLLKVVSGRSPKELIDNQLHFIDDIGLKQHLSPTRSNGLLSMVKQIRLYAVAYNKLQEAQNG
jgi:cysteine desulfuration protein SufE